MTARPRRRHAVAGTVAGVALLTSACAGLGGGSPGAAPTAGSGSDGVTGAQREWMAGLCAALGDVVAVAGRARTFDLARTPEIRSVLAGQVREVQRAVGDVGSALDRLGPPPVDDGARVLREVTDLVDDRREALGKSAAFVEDADPSGTVEYVQVARAAQSASTAGPILINETSRVEGLEDAFAATPACRAVDPGEKGTR